MNQLNAALSGTFFLGGKLKVVRLGFGTMRLTGPGIWGPPEDRGEVLRTLRRLPELGINFIDTADSYGPDISEPLIREALAPYGKLHIATKAGLTRSGPDRWEPKGDPNYLIQQARRSRELLGVEQIDLWQLHRVDPQVPRDEQFAAVRTLLDEGVIRYAGLSEVSIEQIEAARRFFPVATVQNRYNLADRGSEHILEHCENLKIGFIPWFPLAAGKLAGPGTILTSLANAHHASSGQVALAWLLRRSPVMLPIPGTGKIRHLKENVGAAAITLSDEDFVALDNATRG